MLNFAISLNVSSILLAFFLERSLPFLPLCVRWSLCCLSLHFICGQFKSGIGLLHLWKETVPFFLSLVFDKIAHGQTLEFLFGILSSHCRRTHHRGFANQSSDLSTVHKQLYSAVKLQKTLRKTDNYELYIIYQYLKEYWSLDTLT